MHWLISRGSAKQNVEDFYALADYYASRQKYYIVSNVVEMPIKTRTASDSKHREVSRAFYLSYDGLRKRVCGNFFCKTLDLKLRSIQKFLTVHRGRLGLASLSDGRGRHVPRNKTEPWKLDLVRKHIESFPSVESHYCRNYVWILLISLCIFLILSGLKL